MKLLNSYKNGNCDVSIFENGTKIRKFDSDPNPIWPESMDVKITDWCELGCPWCHEKSTTKGQHGDFEIARRIFNDLPRGVELALGGGNPLVWPNLMEFLKLMSTNGIICNMTVNNRHVKKHRDVIGDVLDKGFIKGLGISYNKSSFEHSLEFTENNHVIYHVIMGINTLDDVKLICDSVKNPKILLLGYKQYGRGESFYSKEVEQNLKTWYCGLHEFFNRESLTLSFDNLAIKQLNLKRFFSDETWNTFFMGDDGRFSMYLDLVKREYAKSSTSLVRHPLNKENTIAEIFGKIKSI